MIDNAKQGAFTVSGSGASLSRSCAKTAAKPVTLPGCVRSLSIGIGAGSKSAMNAGSKNAMNSSNDPADYKKPLISIRKTALDPACSFCLKTQNELEVLIQNVEGGNVYICDGRAALCVEIVESKRSARSQA
jgi:hypothetical protein